MNEDGRIDWTDVQAFYDDEHTALECRVRFGVSKRAWYAAVTAGRIALRTSRVARPRGATRTAVANLLSRGFTQSEVAVALGVSKPTVSFHARKLGIPPKSECARRYDWNEVRAYYDAGHSAAECRARFGCGRNAWADAVRRGAIILRSRLEPLSDILTSGRRRSRHHVKTRLLLAGLKEERCEECGSQAWLGEPLSLQLHHLNGDGLDNRLENLRLLCPNCHSQTDTWGARNKGRVPGAERNLATPGR